jgi:hypothetical protein
MISSTSVCTPQYGWVFVMQFQVFMPLKGCLAQIYSAPVPSCPCGYKRLNSFFIRRLAFGFLTLRSLRSIPFCGCSCPAPQWCCRSHRQSLMRSLMKFLQRIMLPRTVFLSDTASECLSSHSDTTFIFNKPGRSRPEAAVFAQG